MVIVLLEYIDLFIRYMNIMLSKDYSVNIILNTERSFITIYQRRQSIWALLSRLVVELVHHQFAITGYMIHSLNIHI